MPPFVIVNESTASELTPAVLTAAAADILLGHDLYFAPEWGRLPGDVRFCARLADAPANARIMHLVDAIPEAPSDLAYHTVDDQGRPTARLGATVCRSMGGSFLDEVTKAIDHEYKETEINPYVAWYVSVPGQQKKQALEVCDPVQGTGFRVNKTMLSAFVLPSYFDIEDSDGPWDFQGPGVAPVLRGALTIAPSGYAAFDDDSQVFGEKMPDVRRWHIRRGGRHHASMVRRRRAVARP